MAGEEDEGQDSNSGTAEEEYDTVQEPEGDPTLLANILHDLEHRVCLRNDKLKLDHSEEYHQSEHDPEWLIHRENTWLYSPNQRVYVHVLTQNCFQETPEGSGHFQTIATDESLGGDSKLEFSNYGGGSEDEGGSTPANEDVEEDDETDEGNSMDLRLELRTAVAEKKGHFKEDMEDRHIAKELLPLDVLVPSSAACCYLFSVFDGHAGHQCVEYCLRHLKLNIMSMLRTLPPAKNEMKWLERCLQKGFQQTDNNYVHYARKNGLTDGSTALLTLFYGPDYRGSLKILTAHVGDSRAVLCRNGVAKDLTHDHKPNHPKERERIVRAGGQVAIVENIWRVLTPVAGQTIGLSTSRSIGDHLLKQPKELVSGVPEIGIYEVDFETDSFLILASDGIWDAMSSEDAVKIVSDIAKNNGSPQCAADALVQHSEAKKHPDDKTAVVVYFGWHPSIPPEEDQQQDVEAVDMMPLANEGDNAVATSNDIPSHKRKREEEADAELLFLPNDDSTETETA